MTNAMTDTTQLEGRLRTFTHTRRAFGQVTVADILIEAADALSAARTATSAPAPAATARTRRTSEAHPTPAESRDLRLIGNPPPAPTDPRLTPASGLDADWLRKHDAAVAATTPSTTSSAAPAPARLSRTSKSERVETPTARRPTVNP